MGEVYQARDTRLDRIVAIKVLGATNGRHDVRKRFQHEARAISKLNHPHVCTVHDVGQHNGIDYLVNGVPEGRNAGGPAKPIQPRL